MSKLETIENQIIQLSRDELAALRESFAHYDAAEWDRQLESDAKSGKLEGLAERALKDHLAGRSTKL